MFDVSQLPGDDTLDGLSDADLVDAAGALARRENAACAAKLAVMAEIFIRRTGLPAGERESWWLDPTAAVAAELAAAQNISRSMALHQTHRGVVLRDRLPQVGALFAEGLVSEMLVRTIVSRTDLVLDDAVMAALDTDLAAEIVAWGPRSAKKTEIAIDALVERNDPGALRRSRESRTTPDLEFGSPTDAPGFTSLWARLYETDAAMIEKCLREMAYSVCEADPRCLGDRLAAAIAAHFAGIDLACACGLDDCEAALRERPTKDLTVYVLTDTTAQDTAAETAPPSDPVDPASTPADTDTDESTAESAEDDPEDEGQLDAHPDSTGTADAGVEDTGVGETGVEHTATRDTGVEDTADNEAEAVPPADEADEAIPVDPATRDTLGDVCATARPGFVFGAGLVPSAVLGGLLAGARVREIRHPGDAGPELHYRPSRALADYIRCRDLTCRFPGCDHPATTADIDHTVPHPVGPTHASNLKSLCRFHHLLKTFWIGTAGWHDRQYPDGTIIWTSPTGHKYTTHPGSRLLFPSLCRPTATLWTDEPPVVTTSDTRGQAMPRRRHTRTQNRARTISAERQLNDDLVAEHSTPPPF